MWILDHSERSGSELRPLRIVDLIWSEIEWPSHLSSPLLWLREYEREPDKQYKQAVWASCDGYCMVYLGTKSVLFCYTIPRHYLTCATPGTINPRRAYDWRAGSIHVYMYRGCPRVGRPLRWRLMSLGVIGMFWYAPSVDMPRSAKHAENSNNP